MKKAEVTALGREAEGIIGTLSFAQTRTSLNFLSTLRDSGPMHCGQKFLKVHMALVPVALPFCNVYRQRTSR